MRQTLSIFLLVCLALLPRLGFSTEGGSRSLFTPAHEADIRVPRAERNGAQFLEMDRARFEALASWKEFTCLISNFPLASDGNVDLRVEQFDAVSKNIQGKGAVPDHVFLRGSVDGFENSHLCLTIYNDCAWGYIYTGEKTYSISSAGRTEMGNLILGIVQDTSTATNFNCGVEEIARNVSVSMRDRINSIQTPPLNAPLATSIPQISVGIEMDSLFVKRAGGSATAAFKYGLSVLAAASDQYMRDANVSLVCATHYEWTTTDPYPDASVCSLLWDFDGSILPGPKPMIRVLMSGRSTDQCGGIAAGIDVLCDPTQSRCVLGISNTLAKSGWDFPYHHWTWDAMVAAHEMGHVIACYHTHDCIWNPPLDSCVAAESPDGNQGMCYSTPVASKGTIMSYCHLTAVGAILKFHPKCSALISSTVRANSCVTSVGLPQLAVSPTRSIQTCSGAQYHFSALASGGTGPYTYEVNPAPDSLIILANGCAIVATPSKSKTYYIRVTDAESVRVYDSIVFSPLASFGVNVVMDSVSAGPDSMVLTAKVPDTTGVAFNWYKLPKGLGWTVGTVQTLTVSRATATQYYVRAAASGGCTAQDTVFVPAAASFGGVADARGGEPVGFSIYPNPATQWLSAILPSPSVRCWIEDVLGRRMDAVATASSNGAASQRVDFDLSRLSAGTYWLVWDAAGKISVSSFLKK